MPKNHYPGLIARLSKFQMERLSLVLVALPERNQLIFKMLCEGISQTNIAASFGVSQARISKIQAQTLNAIKDFL